MTEPTDKETLGFSAMSQAYEAVKKNPTAAPWELAKHFQVALFVLSDPETTAGGAYFLAHRAANDIQLIESKGYWTGSKAEEFEAFTAIEDALCQVGYKLEGDYKAEMLAAIEPTLLVADSVAARRGIAHALAEWISGERIAARGLVRSRPLPAE